MSSILFFLLSQLYRLSLFHLSVLVKIALGFSSSSISYFSYMLPYTPTLIRIVQHSFFPIPRQQAPILRQHLQSTFHALIAPLSLSKPSEHNLMPHHLNKHFPEFSLIVKVIKEFINPLLIFRIFSRLIIGLSKCVLTSNSQIK